jgi:hypothetical protein
MIARFCRIKSILLFNVAAAVVVVIILITVINQSTVARARGRT